jgi:threonine/homoserine/homoserine lactone efflux protein
MSEAALLAWVLVAFAGTMAPGLDTMLVLRHTLLGGRSAGLRVVAGITAGCVVWAVASLAGLTALLATSRVAYDVVRIAGAVYLVWLGASAIWRTLPVGRRDRDEGGDPLAVAARSGPGGDLRAGFLTNLLNPKVGVFYVSLLPQFLPVGPDTAAWGAVLVAIHLATGFLWYPALILLVGRVRRVLLRPAVRRWLDRLTATVLIALGLRLAAEARH